MRVKAEAPLRKGGLMAKVRYGVFQVDGQWLLCCAEHHLGRYPDQVAAVAAARRAAGQAIGSGFDAELLIMDTDGELRRADPASFRSDHAGVGYDGPGL